MNRLNINIISAHACAMARSVSFSDPAFRALRGEKRAGESDSDVLLRLVREARTKRKDPMAFVRNPPEPAWTPHEYDAFRDRMRHADQEKARGLHSKRLEEE